MDWLRKTCWLRACGMVAAAAGLILSHVGYAAGGPRSPSPDEALLWFRGKPVYVHDLTSVSYEHGLKFCRLAFRREQVDGPELVPMILPLDRCWKPPKLRRNLGKSLYLQGLRGVLDDYVRYRVLEEFCKRYHPGLKRYARLSTLASFDREQADDNVKFPLSVVLQAITRHWTAKQFYRAASQALHRTWENRKFWRAVSLHPAYFASIYRAFPPLDARNGKVPLWRSYYNYCGLANIAVAAIVKRKTPFFVHLANAQFGSRAFFVITGLNGDKDILTAVGNLIGTISSPSGHISLARSRKAQKCLALLGSTIILGCGSGPKAYIHSAFGTPISRVHYGCFLKSSLRDGSPCYIYVFQKNPAPIPGLTRTKIANPASWILVFDCAKDYLLRPVVKRVLGELRPGLGLKLPALKWVTGYENSDGALAPISSTGRRLPVVITRRPLPHLP